MKQRVMRGAVAAALFLGGVPAFALTPSDIPSEAPRVILVGDSTMASETGYGDALCRLMKPGVLCLNRAKGGRSTSSYRAEGSWAAILQLLREQTLIRTTYVLIQFGHNDQPGKPGRSTDLATEYPANLERYVREVQAEHAVPILVTPLTRRDFRDGRLQNTLAPWAEAARKVAQEEHAALLDLNADSSRAVQAMGPAEADTLAMAPPLPESSQEPAQKGEHYRGFDHTHLGAKGADYFSRMVEREWRQAMSAAAIFADPVP
ncbi:MAG TPA: rhamnogalacturonan acetylesterase [Burkholderiaceae bacterium]